MKGNYKNKRIMGTPMQGKKGIATVVLWALFAVLGVSVIFTTDQAIQIFENAFSTTFVPGTLLSEFGQHRLAGIGEYQVQNASVFAVRNLYPMENEDFNPTVGMLVVSWSDILNALDNRSLANASQSVGNQRIFFLIIGTNTTQVDPFNNTGCQTEIDNSSYTCVFLFPVNVSKAGGNTFYEVNIQSSSVAHDRQFDIAYLTRKSQFESGLTSTEQIVSLFYDASRRIVTVVVNTVETVAGLFKIALSILAITLLIFFLRFIYRRIAGESDGDRTRDDDESE